MPYIIISANGEELDRVALSARSLIVGRAPDCDVSVHDILMSRHHCRLESSGGAWRLVDLNSKNGTYLGDEPVRQHLFKDGDVLRVGRSSIKFLAGAMVPGTKTKRSRVVRPADPLDALNGTVSDFVYEDPTATQPANPAAAWSCAANSTRNRPLPRPMPVTPGTEAAMQARRRAPAVDWSLQVHPHPAAPQPAPGLVRRAIVSAREAIRTGLRWSAVFALNLPIV